MIVSSVFIILDDMELVGLGHSYQILNIVVISHGDSCWTVCTGIILVQLKIEGRNHSCCGENHHRNTG